MCECACVFVCVVSVCVVFVCVCVCVCARARDFQNENLVAEDVAHSLASVVRKNGYSEFSLIHDLILVV